MQNINVKIKASYMGYKNIVFLLKNQYKRYIKLDNEDLIEEEHGIFSIVSFTPTKVDECIFGIDLNDIYEGKLIEYIKIGDQIINVLK